MTVIDVAFEEAGPPDGPPLLLGSSLGTSRAMWEPQMTALGAVHRVIRFDHRGHGSSPIPDGPSQIADLGGDVLALLDRCGIEKADYAGLSLGGMVGMWLAANHPERINRLGLFCTAAYLPPPQGWLDRAAQVQSAGTESIAEMVLQRWFTPEYASAMPGVVQGVRQQLEQTSDAGYASCCAAIAELDLRKHLAAITAPTLVVVGRSDQATPLEFGQVMVDGIEGARLHLVDGAHLANIEGASACTEVMLDFFGEVGSVES